MAVVLAPLTSAFVGAFAGAGGSYWFYWRVWLLSEALAYLTLAPAILTWIAGARSVRHASIPRGIEACLIGGGFLAISFRVFSWPTAGYGAIPALVYLPLPLLLWAAMRFGPDRRQYVSPDPRLHSRSPALSTGSGRLPAAPQPTTCSRCSCS